MPESSPAIFISYASQDAGPAERLAKSLRDFGLTVWFDRDELTGGDAWDVKIRDQIKTCTLFLPIISANTQARPEGYFRLEWRLADQRTHLMGRSKAFIIPVCLDQTPDTEADVPDSFIAVQWTRLLDGFPSQDFLDRVKQLLSPPASNPPHSTAPAPLLPPAPAPSTSAPKSDRKSNLRPLAITGITLLLAAIGVVIWSRQPDLTPTPTAPELIPQIEQAIAEADWERAHTLAQTVPADSADAIRLEYLWAQFSWVTSIPSSPTGATVYRRAYNSPPDTWEKLGITPLENIHIPFGLSRLRFELADHLPLERSIGGEVTVGRELNVGRNELTEYFVGSEVFPIDTTESLPPGKVRVPGWGQRIEEQEVEFEDFCLGKHEVTNREYQQFVDAGGYENQAYWVHPFIQNDGTTLSWQEAIKRFTDQTDRPGPATWIGGTFADGQEDLPVGGVSWFEAMACARFLGEDLPSVHHWRRAFDRGSLAWILPASNFESLGPAPVGASNTPSWVGALDMAGNVREWTSNGAGQSRFILGGGWSDPIYMAQHIDYLQPAWNRSPINGFRLAITSDPASTMELARRPLQPEVSRDFLAETPVSDEVFEAYRNLFDYSPTPFETKVEETKAYPYWTRYRLSFASARQGERVPLYLFVPHNGQAPHQTVLLWPGAEAFALESIEGQNVYLDFVLKSGRAVAMPIFRDTFDRRNTPGEVAPMSSRDSLIERVNDVRRALDYLSTRPDIDSNAFAFFGFSWGASSSPFILSQEPRVKVAVLNVGGFHPQKRSPELETINYITHVKTPVLMLNGEFDSVCPLEESVRPFFALLGTPATDKKLVVKPGGHYVTREFLVRETLDWLDQYLGRPAR